MYYALLHVSGECVEFRNRSELNCWIEQHLSVLNRITTKKWFLYRTKKSETHLFRELSTCISSLNYYMSKNRLFQDGKK